LLILELGDELSFEYLYEFFNCTIGQIPGMANGIGFPSMFPFPGGTQVSCCLLYLYSIDSPIMLKLSLI